MKKFAIIKFQAIDGTSYVTNVGYTTENVTQLRLTRGVNRAAKLIKNPNSRIKLSKANLTILATNLQLSEVSEECSKFALAYDAVNLQNFGKLAVSIFDANTHKLLHEFTRVKDAADFFQKPKAFIYKLIRTSEIFEGVYLSKDSSIRKHRKLFVYDLALTKIFEGNIYEVAKFINANSIPTINQAIYRKTAIFEKFIISVDEISNDLEYWQQYIQLRSNDKIKIYENKLKQLKLKLQTRITKSENSLVFVYDADKVLVESVYYTIDLANKYNTKLVTIRQSVFRNKTKLSRKIGGFYFSKTKF